MQIHSLEFAGYKAFAGAGTGGKAPQRFDLLPLTLIFGKNNSGKSAVARLPRHLLGGLARRGIEYLPLEVRGLRYASRFVELIHGGDFFGRPRFTLRAEHEGEELDLDLELFSPGALAEDDPPRVWSYEMRSPTKLAIGPPTEDEDPDRATLLAGWLPHGAEWNRWREGAGGLLDSMVHLGPTRAPIEPSYSEETTSPLGFDGEEACQWLRASPELEKEVGAWFAEHMEGWRLSVVRNPGSFRLEVRRSGSMRTNLARAGEGLQQVLPVVLHQLWRRHDPETPFLDVVEQPELHLHDAAQAPLADLFLETALQGRGKTLVETHSEPLLLRVQRRVAEGVDPGKVGVYFVEVTDSGSELRRIHMDRNGEVDWWPEGVFQEDFLEVAAIRRAQRGRPSGDGKG